MLAGFRGQWPVLKRRVAGCHSTVIHLVLIIVAGAIGADGPMLNKLSQDIAECYLHAGDCAQKAKSERNARLRQDFLEMQGRWLFLAHSYELAEQLESCQPRRKR